MIIIVKYEQITRHDNVIVIVSKETEALCPCCKSKLSPYGFRERKYKNQASETKTLIIRRLKCQNSDCGRIHHELPDYICPYKRHSSDVCQDVIEGKHSIAFEPSFRYRLIRWFVKAGPKLDAGLRSAGMALGAPKDEQCFSLAYLMRNSSEWLKKVARVLANSFRWPRPAKA
jgi:hypothetical protein